MFLETSHSLSSGWGWENFLRGDEGGDHSSANRVVDRQLTANEDEGRGGYDEAP